MVTDRATGEYIGIIGEYKATVKKAFKLEGAVAGFELDPRAALKAAESATNGYVPLSRYPSTERDISLQVNRSVSYAQVKNAALSGLESTNVHTEVTPIDFYQPESGETKNITLRVRINSSEKTLTADDAADVMRQMAESVISTLGATVV